MSASVRGLGRGIAVRFGIVTGVVFLFPFPLGYLPKTDWLGEHAAKPLEWLSLWVARSILGLGDLPTAFNGSGDRTYDYVRLLTMAMLCVLGTLLWLAVERRRTSYPRSVAALYFALRYTVARALLFYGFAKICRSQFSDLLPSRLPQEYGDMSPMRVLWQFMGYSAPYTVFAGLAEAFGGALLLWRRTATIGALVVAAVMTNVVMLNFCYDVPVKLYSTRLLIMAVVIALPRARRLLAAAMGRATPDEPPRARMSPRWERALWVLHLALVAWIAWGLYDALFSKPSRSAHVHELYGTWKVDAFVVDGLERAPLLTDSDRWRAVSANPKNLVIWPMTGEREALSLTVDAAAQSLTVELDDDIKDKERLKEKAEREKAREASGASADSGKGKDVKDDPGKETWKYTRPSPDQLVIDGVHRGKPLHVTLHLEAPRLLMTRGFRWINEQPFNR